MKLVQEFLSIGVVIASFGDCNDLVKWEILELCFNKLVLRAFSWYNIGKVQAFFHSHTAINASGKEEGKQKQDKYLMRDGNKENNLSVFFK